MKPTIALVIAGTAAGGLLLASCGGGDSTASAPPIPMPVITEDLDTAQVLTIAQTKTSETSSPFVVDGGAVLVTPTDDDTGTPITVNGS